MTVIELSDEQAAKLKAQARVRGLTIEQWIAQLTRQAAPAPVSPEGRTEVLPIWDVIADNMKDVPAEEFEKFPKDGASQIDHYLYGSPKR